MAAELYFFKFNAKKAKTKLSFLIKTEGYFSFRQYLFERSGPEANLKFDEICKATGKNIELLSPENLFSLFNWFFERVEKLSPNLEYNDFKKGLYEELSSNGMDLFFEIPSKTPVEKFHNLLLDYESLISQEIENPCDTNQLAGFLNYIICYSGELTIFLNKHYYKKGEVCEENLEIRKTITCINSESNSYYHKLALSQVRNSLEYNIETMQLIPKLIEIRQTNRDKPSYSYLTELNDVLERESDIVSSAVMLYTALDLKEKLENYSGKVTRLHSF